MSKFDGYLICSDLDGTFRSREDAVAINSKAVKYFIDNGGRFTFITGRAATHLRECGFNNLINAPAGVYNGAVIYDFEKEKVLYEKRLTYAVGDFIDAIRTQLELQGTLNVYYDFLTGKFESIPFKHINGLLKDIRKVKPIKIVCTFSSKEDADSFKAFAENNIFFSDSAISKSWSAGVEFNSLDATKGVGIKFLKEFLGNIHTSIGVGDYDNDVSLITRADIGVAVGNAVDELKCVADMVVCNADDGAIKDLVEKIENGL